MFAMVASGDFSFTVSWHRIQPSPLCSRRENWSRGDAVSAVLPLAEVLRYRHSHRVDVWMTLLGGLSQGVRVGTTVCLPKKQAGEEVLSSRPTREAATCRRLWVDGI